ncbi:MAG: VOC family protein [Albidovulum sp.]|nr:VOC family protein [Albidovulum sp.]MDE0307759.1 VOC family protein [Albidovulum sp.]MDE0532067.1 VOC family protein [Albidovulum sp.]
MENWRPTMGEYHGTIYWSELMTRDFEGAKRYYADICGWTFGSMEGMEGMDDTYMIAFGEDPSMPLCGIGDMDKMQLDKNVPPHWFTYIAVDDVDAVVEKTRSAGGNVIREPFEVSNVGRIAIVTDPTGAAIGYVKPGN